MRAVLLVLAAGLAWGAAPPAALTPGQMKLLGERNRLWQAGVKAWKAGKQEDAIAFLQKVLKIEMRLMGPWHRNIDAIADRLGDWHQARGDWAREAECRRAVIAARAKLRGEGDHRTADARLKLAEALAQPKRTAAQRDALREALLLNEEVFSLWQKGQSAKALPLAKRALSLRKGVLGDGHPAIALSLLNLAAQHRAMGDNKAALPLYQKALALYKEVLGARHPDYVESLNSLAVTHQAMGDHRAALPMYREALALRKEVLGTRHPGCAASLNNLAALLQDMGDHKAALPLYREALALRKDVLGTRHPDYATSLNNLASLHKEIGDHKSALTLHKQALALRKEVLGARHPDYADSLNNLAGLHQAMEDHRAALPLYREALALTKEVLGTRHPHYAQSLNNLALLLHAMGDDRAALPLLKEALALRKDVLGTRHPDYADSLNSLAFTLKAMGDDRAALPLHEKALAIISAQLRSSAAVQSDRQQLAAAAAVRGYLDNRLSLSVEGGHSSAAGHVLAWKGSVLLRQQQRRLFLRVSADPAARGAAGRLQAATRHLASLRMSPTATREKLEELERGQEAAQAELARLSEAFREDRDRGRPDAKALAKSLPEGAALVDYLFYGSKLAAFIHRRGRPTGRVELGPAKAVVDAARDWLKLLARGGGRGTEEEVPPLEKGGPPGLRGLIWTPLEKHLEGAKVVLVSPDGVLGTVPFAALPGKKRGTYLLEDVALAVVPVPSAIPEMMRPVDKAARLKPTLLVAGDLRYEPEKGGKAPPAGEDTRSAPRTGRERFVPLPATRAEMLAVRGSFEKLFKGGAATALSEGDATKAAVRKHLPNVRYAHLATHGYFAPETVKSALSGDAPGERLGGPRELIGWHPLLLSGLALSDANRDPGPGEEDGILTALEVSEMDLTKLELAVLSACETGLGKVAGGEGILGMQRAFQIAGARTVIASLWKVDDKATMQLMSDFYVAAWDPKKVVSRAEALRQAQLNILRDGKRRGVGLKAEKIEGKGGRLPPYYWAAFVLSGDWR